ncbi:MAG: hypothetical protein LJE69_06930 [Thiohalocapsa sp.]|jgi:hypothetical protein|uniref:hypothetical protein n=1 Tax=Thiohalocapsa sp. TaxID=2497641 RepID=UPI0025DEEB75|nr:hypothetical protein [Thiohalocapsa sp.]MCG6940968.1 hypothetical protein [Thiohalocapsa sp.]
MIDSFSCHEPDASPLAAIARVAALFESRLADRDGLLGTLLPEPLADQLTFDHVGVMVPRGDRDQVARVMAGLGFRVVEQFESTVVASMLRARCGQTDLIVGVTMAERIGDARCRIEVFCPENPNPACRASLSRMAPDIGHVAFRPAGGADFGAMCRAVTAHGFQPLTTGTNSNQQHGPGAGSGVCLRYFSKPECALGAVKLEIVSPILAPPVTGLAGQKRPLRIARYLLAGLWPSNRPG